jgi:hypothetical protein
VSNLPPVAYTAAEGRQQLLAEFGDGVDQIALALAGLGAAYEKLDEQLSDRLEEELFRPVQLAYGRAQRTHSTFSQRHGFPPRKFVAASPGLESLDARALIDRAADALIVADDLIATVQDSMLPVEVGDKELRAGLSEVRTLIANLPARAHQLVRVIGR